MLRVSKSIPWFGTDERVSRRTVRMTSVRPTLRGRGAHTEPEKDELEKTETEQEGLRSGETEDGAAGTVTSNERGHSTWGTRQNNANKPGASTFHNPPTSLLSLPQHHLENRI